MAVATETTRLVPASSLPDWGNDPDYVSRGDHIAFAPGSTKNPRNWRPGKKWLVILTASLYGLIGPALSAMVVPALPQIAADLQLSSEAAIQMIMSLTVLGWSIGPMVLAPLSEHYGRRPVLNYLQLLFLVVNIYSSFESNGTRFLLMRFLAGFLGSAPVSIGSGMVSDMWNKDVRGKSLAIYSSTPLLAPAIGPIVGAFLYQSASWRWILHFCSIYTAITLVLGLAFIEESFAPVLLKQEQCRRRTNSEELAKEKSSLNSLTRTFAGLIRNDISRSFVLLGTQPIIQFLALYMSFLFGLNHMTIATFHTAWRDIYGQDNTTASLNYISIAAGFVVGVQAAGQTNDTIYRLCKRIYNDPDGKPEYRTYTMLPAGLFLLPVGQLIYGFAVAHRLLPLVPNLGIFLYSAGLISAFQCITAYVLDCYPVYAASAVSALMPLRGVAGGLMPILGPMLYRKLGYDGGSALLAGLLGIIGVATPLVLKKYGPAMRARSQYATAEVKVDV